ncbi:uncharacterized protein isoform X2 [Choristoneura fumiferana]|uniref:uncharacterized protein isoform X2 n=1 Tax=Choristoneura fumiferana TaxID=7141 RepID=UPI003D154148
MQGQQNAIISGIDPTYLAAYSNNTPYVAGHQHQQMQREMQMERQMQFLPDPPFGSDYQNRNLMLVDRNNYKTFTPQADSCETPRPQQVEISVPRVNNYEKVKPTNPCLTPQLPKHTTSVPKKPNGIEILKNELQSQILTRSDKLKALHKRGPRVFSGPVEKVLKWHKALQDVGVLIIFEIVAKCVSIRAGESCAKNLVIRDDNGPAMQVVYYEIDFLLAELKLPCTVRVIGRMMPGTCRLQAFNVRAATGDDVATLSRRAAVASHHVAKLCKEYGATDDKN